MYYVYEWFIVETGEVFYVGKGSGRRYKVRKHNKFFNDMITRFECSSRIVKTFEKEEDAFLYERDLVNQWREKGQCVCNIYDGGCGGTTSWWTEERRKEYSSKNCMKSQNQRDRMSKNNPMKNPKTVEAVIAYKKRPVVIGDKEYCSVIDVMREYNTSHGTVQKWCRKGITKDGIPCRYKDEEQKIYTGRYNKGSCKAVIYKGKRYESGADLAKELGMSQTVISRWARNGFSPSGERCFFEGHEEETPKIPKIKFEDRKKKVIVNGVKYNSIREAEDALGINRGTLSPYINGKRKNNKYICEYDNQQPSQENSD